MKRSKKIAVGCLIILSLFVSSVAACICSHHTKKAAPEISSCHEHSETKAETDSSEKVQKLGSNDECFCVQPAPKAFSKSETVKIEKQAMVLSVLPTENKAVAIDVSGADFYFEKPFYLSDSFYNIKSPRAPPAA